MKRYKNGAACPACERGTLVQIGLVQKCDTCDTSDNGRGEYRALCRTPKW